MKRQTEITDDPATWPVSRLKAFLSENGVSIETMTERGELVDSARAALTSIGKKEQKKRASEAETTGSPLSGNEPVPREKRTADQWAKVKLFNPTACPEFSKEIAYLRKNTETTVPISTADSTSGKLLESVFRILVLNRSFDVNQEPQGFRYIHQVGVGDDNGRAMAKAVASKGCDQKICGKSLKRTEMVFRCLECAADPTCILCAECFNNSPCVNHEYRMTTSGGGMCDCGDPSAWKSSSFCTKHRGASPEDDPTKDMDPKEKAWVSTVLRGVTLQCITIVRRLSQGNIPADSPIEGAFVQCLSMLKHLAGQSDIALRLVLLAVSEEQSLAPPLRDPNAGTALPRPKEGTSADNDDVYGKTSLLEELVREDGLGIRNRFKASWSHVSPLIKLLITDMSSKLVIMRALTKYFELSLRPDPVTISNSRTQDDVMKNSLASEAVQVMTVPWAAEASLQPNKLRLGPRTTSIHRILSGILYGLSALHSNVTYPVLPAPFSASSGPTAIMKYSKDVSSYKHILLQPFYNIGYLLVATPMAGRLFASSEVMLRAYSTIMLSAHVSDLIRREDSTGEHNYFTWDLNLGSGSLQRRILKSIYSVLKSLPADTVDTFKALSTDSQKFLRSFFFGQNANNSEGEDNANEPSRTITDDDIRTVIKALQEKIVSSSSQDNKRAGSVEPLKDLNDILPLGMRLLTQETKSLPPPPLDCVPKPDALFQSQLDKCEARLRYPILNPGRTATTTSGLLPLQSRIEYASALVALIGSFLNEASAVNAKLLAPSYHTIMTRTINTNIREDDTNHQNDTQQHKKTVKLQHFCAIRQKHATTFVIPLIRLLAPVIRNYLSAENSSNSVFISAATPTSEHVSFTPARRRAYLLERLLLACPPFAELSILGSRSTDSTDSTTETSTVPLVSIHDWIDMPLRAILLSGQVADQLWKRDYFDVQRQAGIYREFQPAYIKEMDLFTLQYLTAVVGSHNMAAQLLARFSYVPQDDRHEVKQAPIGYPHFLELILSIVGDDNQSSCSKRKANMNRILRTMAPLGPIIHSQLMDSINRETEDEDDEAESQENAKALQELLVSVTTAEQQRKGTVRRLKNDPALWAGISSYNSDWDINLRNSALAEYNILFKRGANSAPPSAGTSTASPPPQHNPDEFPRALVGKHHEALIDPIRSLLHTAPSIATALFAVLNKTAEIQEMITIAEKIAAGGAAPPAPVEDKKEKKDLKSQADALVELLQRMRQERNANNDNESPSTSMSSDIDYLDEEDEEALDEMFEEGEEHDNFVSTTEDESPMGTPSPSQPRSDSTAKKSKPLRKSESSKRESASAQSAVSSPPQPQLPPLKFVKVTDTYFLAALDFLLLTMEDAAAIALEEKQYEAGNSREGVNDDSLLKDNNGVVDFGYFESWHQRVNQNNPYNKSATTPLTTGGESNINETSTHNFNCDFFLPLPEMAGRSPFLHSLAKVNFKHSKLLTPKNIIPTSSTLDKIARHKLPLHVLQQQSEPLTIRFRDEGLSLISSLPLLVKYLSLELENQLRIKTSLDKAVAEVYLAKVRKLIALIANEPKIVKNEDSADAANDAEAKANAERDAKTVAERAARIKEKQQLLMARMKKKQEKASAAHNIVEAGAGGTAPLNAPRSGDDDVEKIGSGTVGSSPAIPAVPNTHETLMMKATEIECCFCRLADDGGELMWLAHAASSSNVSILKKQRGSKRFSKNFTIANPSKEELEQQKIERKTREMELEAGTVATTAPTTAIGTTQRNLRGHHPIQGQPGSDDDDDDYTDTDSEGGFRAYNVDDDVSEEQDIAFSQSDDDNHNEEKEDTPKEFSTRFTVSKNIKPRGNRLTVSVMTCGHAAHMACVEKHHAYLNTQRGRGLMDLLRSQRGFRGMEFLGGAEFCCPICTKIASVLCCMPKLSQQQQQPQPMLSSSSLSESINFGQQAIVPGCFSEWVSASIATASQTRAFKSIVSECAIGLSRSADHPPLDELRTDAWARILNISALEALLSSKTSSSITTSSLYPSTATKASVDVSKNIKPFAADYLANVFYYGLTMADNITLLLEGRIKLNQEHGASTSSASSAPTEVPLPHIANLAALVTTAAVSIFDEDGSAFMGSGTSSHSLGKFRASNELKAVFGKILEAVVAKKTLEKVALDYDSVKRTKVAEEIQRQLSIEEKKKQSTNQSGESSNNNEDFSTPLSPKSNYPWWFVTGAIGNVVDKTKNVISKTAAAVGNVITHAVSAGNNNDKNVGAVVGMYFKFDKDKDAKLANISLPGIDVIELYGLLCSFYFAAAAETTKIAAKGTSSSSSTTAATVMEAAIAELVDERTFAAFVSSVVSSLANIKSAPNKSAATTEANNNNNDPFSTHFEEAISTLWHALVQLSLFKHILTGTLPAPLPVGGDDSTTHKRHHHHHHQHTAGDSPKDLPTPAASPPAVAYGAYLLPLRTHGDQNHHVQLIIAKVIALITHLCPSFSLSFQEEISSSELLKTLSDFVSQVAPIEGGKLAAVAQSFLLSSSGVSNTDIISSKGSNNNDATSSSRLIAFKPIKGELSIEEATKARCNDFVYLPPNYHAYIATATALKNCSACGASNCAMMCLKCRALLCLRAKPTPEALFHSQTCGGGVGLFLLLKGSAYVVISGVSERAAQNNPVYVDRFGEFDNGLRRGVALTLSTRYVGADLLTPLITNTWDHDTNTLKNAFRHSVATL